MGLKKGRDQARLPYRLNRRHVALSRHWVFGHARSDDAVAARISYSLAVQLHADTIDQATDVLRAGQRTVLHPARGQGSTFRRKRSMTYKLPLSGSRRYPRAVFCSARGSGCARPGNCATPPAIDVDEQIKGGREATRFHRPCCLPNAALLTGADTRHSYASEQVGRYYGGCRIGRKFSLKVRIAEGGMECVLRLPYRIIKIGWAAA